MRTPSADLDTRYSEPEAEAPDWDETAAILAAAELSWITTVRSDGTPHVTPLITVVHEGTTYFCTGPEEQKARNLRGNPAVALTTGTNALHGGTDVVLEGRAERVPDDDLIAALVEAWVAQYGERVSSLPTRLARFTGRREELAAVDEAARSAREEPAAPRRFPPPRRPNAAARPVAAMGPR